MRPIISVLILSGFWLMDGSAAAFEQHGFQSGMTLAEAKASTQEPLMPVQGSEGNYSVGTGGATKAIISFCKGRLFSVSENIAGGVDAFAARTAKNNARFGTPVVTAASDYTNDGLLSDVRMTWLSPQNEEHSVAVSAYQGNVWASVSSNAHKSLCN